MPAPEEAAALSTVIGELAAANGLEAFAPHVTLLTGLPDDIDVVALEAKLRDIVDASPPIDFLRFSHVVHSAIFFQCLVAAIAPAYPLQAVHDAVKTAFPPVKAPPNPTYFPHLSLACAWLLFVRR